MGEHAGTPIVIDDRPAGETPGTIRSKFMRCAFRDDAPHAPHPALALTALVRDWAGIVWSAKQTRDSPLLLNRLQPQVFQDEVVDVAEAIVGQRRFIAVNSNGDFCSDSFFGQFLTVVGFGEQFKRCSHLRVCGGTRCNACQMTFQFVVIRLRGQIKVAGNSERFFR